jgi:hypothetical protein
MKKLIQCGFASPRNIVNRVLRGSGMDIIRAMGDFETIYRMLRDYKLKLTILSHISMTN